MNPVDAKHLLGAIEESNFSPDKKEYSFIETVKQFISDGRYLSLKQSKWLQDIYRKSQQRSYQRKQYI